MMRLLPVLLLVAALSAAQGAHGDDPPPGGAALPVGKWEVEFANGVKEVCDIGDGGEATVEEPGRKGIGKAEARGGSVVITFGDDRAERWTPVGRRYVVEHWFPASRVPAPTPVLGIADRAP